jgi:nucleotidyltransferase/DNA polymerase involved in DNA repair
MEEKEMNEHSKKLEAIKRLRSLRNIGIVTAEKLYSIGIKTPEQIIKSNPERLYEKLKAKHGGKLDRCVLYQIRGAKLDEPWWKCKS